MAIKPTEQSDVFLREVDEELRRERITTFFTRYGWLVLAGVVLLLAGIAGGMWWRQNQEAKAAEKGEALLQAMEQLQAGNRNAALPKINELASSNNEGYQAAGLFARAGAEIAANNQTAAVATLKSIFDNDDFADAYRNAALIRQTQIEFDRLPPQQVIQRLQPLANAGSAWFGSAGEMVAVAHLKMNRPQQAAPIFAAIARDENVPPSIRQRAVQMAGSLGVNAVGEPGATQASGPATPAPAAAAPAPPAGEAADAPAAAREVTK